MPSQRKLQCPMQTPWVLRSSKWIERPPGVCEVIGSNPVRDSDFFLCPTLVTRWSFHFHICFTELKIYHLSFFESCNVFSSIKFVQFNNIRQQILNWWHVFQVVYAIWAMKHFKDIPVLKRLHRNTNYSSISVHSWVLISVATVKHRNIGNFPVKERLK